MARYPRLAANLLRYRNQRRIQQAETRPATSSPTRRRDTRRSRSDFRRRQPVELPEVESADGTAHRNRPGESIARRHALGTAKRFPAPSKAIRLTHCPRQAVFAVLRLGRRSNPLARCEARRTRIQNQRRKAGGVMSVRVQWLKLDGAIAGEFKELTGYFTLTDTRELRMQSQFRRRRPTTSAERRFLPRFRYLSRTVPMRRQEASQPV